MKKILNNIVNFILVATLTWIILSYVDTISHNLTDHVYQTWNLFRMLL